MPRSHAPVALSAPLDLECRSVSIPPIPKTTIQTNPLLRHKHGARRRGFDKERCETHEGSRQNQSRQAHGNVKTAFPGLHPAHGVG